MKSIGEDVKGDIGKRSILFLTFLPVHYYSKWNTYDLSFRGFIIWMLAKAWSYSLHFYKVNWEKTNPKLHSDCQSLHHIYFH